MKGDEGIHQSTRVNDSWTGTVVWGLTVGAGGRGLGGGDKGGKIGTTVIA